MAGLLLPLILAAVLSVVAVKAARSSVPPRPAARARLPGRALAAAGIAAATAAGLVALAGQGDAHGGAASPSCASVTSAARCR